MTTVKRFWISLCVGAVLLGSLSAFAGPMNAEERAAVARAMVSASEKLGVHLFEGKEADALRRDLMDKRREGETNGDYLGRLERSSREFLDKTQRYASTADKAFADKFKLVLHDAYLLNPAGKAAGHFSEFNAVYRVTLNEGKAATGTNMARTTAREGSAAGDTSWNRAPARPVAATVAEGGARLRWGQEAINKQFDGVMGLLEKAGVDAKILSRIAEFRVRYGQATGNLLPPEQVCSNVKLNPAELGRLLVMRLEVAKRWEALRESGLAFKERVTKSACAGVLALARATNSVAQGVELTKAQIQRAGAGLNYACATGNCEDMCQMRDVPMGTLGKMGINLETACL